MDWELMQEKLSPEILTMIFAHVPARDLVLNCRRVCKAWKQLVDGKTLWARKYELDFRRPTSLLHSLFDISILCVSNEIQRENLPADGHVTGMPRLRREDDTVNFPGMAPGPFPGCTSVSTLTGHRNEVISINLLRPDLTQEFLDSAKPPITVSLWMGRKEHSSGTAMGAICLGEDEFMIRPNIRSDAHPSTFVDSLKADRQSFTFRHTVVESVGSWYEARYTFTNYNSGAHIINFLVDLSCDRAECSKDPCEVKLRPVVRLSKP